MTTKLRVSQDNPDGEFANAEACYVLAYATIMLATDLYNVIIYKSGGGQVFPVRDVF